MYKTGCFTPGCFSAGTLITQSGWPAYVVWHKICSSIYKRIIMADDKNITSVQDRIRIDVNDPSEVKYVHSFFPELEHEQIVEAIKEKGPVRKNVMEYLKTKYRV